MKDLTTGPDSTGPDHPLTTAEPVDPTDPVDSTELAETADDEIAPATAGRGLLRDNLSVAGGTMLSRITGVGRWGALLFALAPSLGDAYLLANNTPNIIYELILGGVLTATLVPLFTEHLEHADDDSTNAVVSVTLVALLVLAVLTAAAAPLLIFLYSSNTGGNVDADVFRSVGTRLSILFAPQVLFYGLMAIGSALLNARRRFFAAAWAPVLNNVIVTTMLVLVGVLVRGDPTLSEANGDTTLILVLGLGTTAGIVVMALALVPAMRRAGIHLRFRPDWRHPAVRKALTLSGWTLGYVIANQIAAQTVNWLAEPGSGGVTAYQTAFVFFQLPHGLLAVSIMTTFQPDMARAAVQRDHRAFNAKMLLGLRALAMLVTPAAVGYLVLPGTLSDAAGASADTVLGQYASVATVLSAFGLGLIGFSAYLFVLRGFYAHKDTRTPFFLNLGENAVNVVLAVALAGRYGVQGLAWSYAIAYSVSAVVSLAVLTRRVPGFDVAGLIRSVARVAVAATTMGVVVWVLMRAVIGDDGERMLLAAALGIGAGVVVYGAMALLLRLPQETGLNRLARRRAAG